VAVIYLDRPVQEGDPIGSVYDPTRSTLQNNNSLQNFDSFVVTDPDLVDEGIDVSGLRTQTDTSPFLLGNIPDYSGIQYSTLAPTKYTDLMRLYSQGLPMFDTPQAAAPVTTAPDTGDGGQAILPIDTIQPIDTPITTDLTDDQINEFATEDTTMPPMLSPDMIGNIDTTPVDTAPINMSPLADEQFVDTTSGLDDVNMNLIDQPFADTPVTLGSGNNALGLTDPQSLAIGPSGAVDFNTGGLDDITNIPERTLTSAQAPVEQASPGIMNPYDPSQSTVLGANPDINKGGLEDDFLNLIGQEATEIEDIPVELPATNIETAIEPQAVNTILGPDGITYDAVTGNPIYEDLDAQAAATDSQVADLPLEQTNQILQIINNAGENIQGALTEIGKIPGAIVDKVGKTVTLLGQKIDIGKTIASALINKAAGAPISLLFSLLPDDGIHQSTKAARDTGLLTGDTTVTQDKYGINTQTSFDPAKSAENYLDYNVKQVEKLETALAKTRAKYATEQEYLDMTTRMRQELADRQKYVDYQTGVGSTYDTADPNIAGSTSVIDTGSVDEAGLDIADQTDIPESTYDEEIFQEPEPTPVDRPTMADIANSSNDRNDGPAPSAPQKATETASYSNENEYESAAYDQPKSAPYQDAISRGQTGGGNDRSNGGGGCCFIMLESRYGDGTMDKVVRRYRDEKMTPRNRRGYYKMARVLVPLMRKSKVFKWIVAKTFADPLVSYGKWYYGENKHGWIFAPVKTAWLKIFDVVGTDTVFIRENGEEV